MDLQRNLAQRINVGDALTRSAAARPEHPAVVDGDRRLTYAQFDAWVNRLAHGLLARGYAVGDALALAAGNSAEFLAVYYACAKTGVVCVPINLGWRPHEIAYVLRHSEARGFVVETQLVATINEALAEAPGVAEVVVAPGTGDAVAGAVTLDELTSSDDTPPEVAIDDRAALSYLYTSGTTSFPKGVVGTHLAIHLESMSAALDSGWNAQDRFVAMMPMFHTAQLNAFCTPAVIVGATIHVHRGFDPARFLETIERERITQVFGLPMMYRAALDHPSFASRDLSSLRRAVYAMAPMPEAQIQACLDGYGCDFALLFGQTEMSPITTLFRPEHQLTHVGSVGTPLTGVQVGIMDPDGQLLPPGQQGEIVYRGPSTMQEYLHDEAATDTAFAHGWFHSGDVGLFGDDGVLWFADRTKDVIKTGGENVASLEVERAVYDAEPDVAEVVVVGLPHARWSEAITAVVVAKEGTVLEPDKLIAALKDRLDGYKVPKAVIVVDEFPRTSTGKIQKNVVRDQHTDHYGGR
ncbi:acyl-CoA synthetase (AMP-forming)/AMP-acid ligase II [Actinomycetospora succinea]|uniref:Acyl-CoA synthetase (AMP-forming)/AMP-acid ligase II n=1 Tax=Actinomycetospora succinea TaxID=663603 RepID=A0A4V6PWZ9_9PSEU|nr:AMP-binding protein [Actinomycetospora succinea]TDQ58822.1 acyl-CoA synthetase (AMP-forming)/AMP-acid ligase II [Actinomycetospora succinea]